MNDESSAAHTKTATLISSFARMTYRFAAEREKSDASVLDCAIDGSLCTLAIDLKGGANHGPASELRTLKRGGRLGGGSGWRLGHSMRMMPRRIALATAAVRSCTSSLV